MDEHEAALEQELEQSNEATEEALEETPADESLAEDESSAEDIPPPEAPAIDKKKKKTKKGPNAWTWSAAVVIMLIGLFALIPSLCNSVLALPALNGLLLEAQKRYSAALAAYDQLSQLEQQAASWGLENFALLSTDAPGLTAGQFVTERTLSIYYRLYGPMQTLDNFKEQFPTGTEIPRSLRAAAAEYKALGAVVENINKAYEANPEGDTALTDAIETARKGDKVKANAIYYDALALQYAMDPTDSDGINALIEKIKKDPAGKPWMYENSLLYRAILDNDYSKVISACESRLVRNREDAIAMEYQVKATYLAQGQAPAFALADRFFKRTTAASDVLRLTKAELYNRGGKYVEAIKLCDTVIADSTASSSGAGTEAVAVKAVAQLLSGKAEEALGNLRSAMSSQNYNPSTNFISTLLAAAIEAGDDAFYESFLESDLATYQYYLGYELPQKLLQLKADETTIKAIFTEGWGGFDA